MKLVFPEDKEAANIVPIKPGLAAKEKQIADLTNK
jgi:hypothetical protein